MIRSRLGMRTVLKPTAKAIQDKFSNVDFTSGVAEYLRQCPVGCDAQGAAYALSIKPKPYDMKNSAGSQAALAGLGDPSDSAGMSSALKAVRTASLNCYLFEVGDDLPPKFIYISLCSAVLDSGAGRFVELSVRLQSRIKSSLCSELHQECVVQTVTFPASQTSISLMRWVVSD